MNILKNIGLMALAYLLAMAALDFYLQSAEIFTPMKSRISPDIGPTFAPGTKVTRFNEGFSDTGCRGGRERPEKRQPVRRWTHHGLLGNSQ